jgi:1-deoxy-D-xylulose-5-phosphate synthase
MASMAVSVAAKLEAQGHTVAVVDPRWVLPVSPDVVTTAGRAGAVAVIEDNLVEGGIGSAVTSTLGRAEVSVPVHCFGIPKKFLQHASRGQVMEEIGLTADSIATRLASSLH